jgi:hypothetical protein
MIERTHVIHHVFLVGANGAEPAFRTLSLAAASLAEVDASRRAALCIDASSVTHDRLQHAPIIEGGDVTSLLRARRFVRSAAVIGEPVVPEVAAFRRLLGEENARDAFLHLVAHGGVPAKIYGLAGLRIVDRDAFDDVLCSVVATIDASVSERTVCGERTVSVRELLLSSDTHAVRDERHWGAHEWRFALRHGPTDVAGGGISYELTQSEDESENVIRMLGSSGARTLTPTSVRAGRGVEARRGEMPRLFTAAYERGFCVVRTDGRVACWGDSLDEPRVKLAPDLVRHPLDYVGGALTCMLDARRQRVCAYDPHRERELVENLCSIEIPDGLIAQRFDDGPWRSLFERYGNTCGVHEDGSVHCFVGDGFSRVVPEGARYGSAFRLPIEGEVVGVAEGHASETIFWTNDHRVLRMNADMRVEALGTLDEIAYVTAGFVGPIFAVLRDGRVFAYGVSRRERQFWARSHPREERWIEISELRGARMFTTDYHGCALFPDGRVSCFGASDHGERGPDVEDDFDGAPNDVASLQGADTLHLLPQATCGRFGAVKLRCLGLHVPTFALTPTNPDDRGPVDIRLPLEATSP